MSDYDRIEKAMVYLVERAIDQPGLDEVAAHVHPSPYHFQRIFCRLAGTVFKIIDLRDEAMLVNPHE